ncbi:trigger factor [Glycomyces buryatensis]|uniref:Trigger factor n=1 Tax=Glycomyces buryatensis TaxID=2570927 RepID=A0A4S8QCB4_9ACTN|nr:trigger factor [Glycomyces buryatensis]THV38699.1 trigger factor [Glycomyces buryatensis]
MKSTVETLSPTRVRLSVEVPFEELAPFINEAYKSLGQQIRVPGFRPGKAPRAVIDQRVGRESVYAQAMDPAVQSNLNKAVTENDVNALGRPELTDVKPIEEGKPFEFTVETDVTPDFELPDFASLKVTVEAAGVTEEDIDADLESQRLRFSSLKTVERAAAEGDFVVIDLKATQNGEEVEGGSVSGMSHEVGQGNLLDGLDEALVGMAAGDDKTIQSTLAGEQEGETADVEVHVQQVKERELPPLDDDFAEMSSPHDTLEELREATRERLDQQSVTGKASEARQKVLEALVEAVELPLPEKTIEDEITHTRSHLEEQVTQMAGSFEDYLTAVDKTAEEFDADLRKDVESNLQQSLILGRIATEKKLEVGGDLMTAEVVRQAQQRGVPQEQFQEFVDELRGNGGLQQIAANLRQQLALEEVVKEASIVDAQGKELTEDDLFPGRAKADADAEIVEEADVVKVDEE